MKKLIQKFFDYINPKTTEIKKIEPGETELDYIGLDEINPIKNKTRVKKKTPNMGAKKI